MRLASVSLPKLQLASHEQRLGFALEGSLQLRFPNRTRLPKTSSDLLKRAKEKHLWIARTGSCYFQLEVSLQGEPVSEEDQVAKLAEWVKDCEVWSRVGVCLQHQERGVGEPTGRVAFSIQHPDLSSSLVTQKDAFAAEFESVTCRVDLAPLQEEPLKEKQSLKRKRDSQPDKAIRTQQLDGVSSDDQYLACLSADDQRVIDEFIRSLQIVSPQQGTVEPTPKATRSSPVIEFSDRFKQLFETALVILVLGSVKMPKGIVTVECNRAECLTRLAPAVFSMPYLKIISDRAALLPIIATSLARMRNAESPSLRQKAASFAARVTDTECSLNDRVVRGIEQSAWHVLLSTTKISKPPTRLGKGGQVVERAAPTAEYKQSASSILPQVVDRADGAEGALTATGSSIHDHMGDGESTSFQQHSPQCLEPYHSLPHAETTKATECEFKADPNYTFLGAMEDPFMTEAAMLNYDPLPVDIGSTTFDEWLCTSGSEPEYLGYSRPTYIDLGASSDIF